MSLTKPKEAQSGLHPVMHGVVWGQEQELLSSGNMCSCMSDAALGALSMLPVLVTAALRESSYHLTDQETEALRG